MLERCLHCGIKRSRHSEEKHAPGCPLAELIKRLDKTRRMLNFQTAMRTARFRGL